MPGRILASLTGLGIMALGFIPLLHTAIGIWAWIVAAFMLFMGVFPAVITLIWRADIANTLKDTKIGFWALSHPILMLILMLGLNFTTQAYFYAVGAFLIFATIYYAQSYKPR